MLFGTLTREWNHLQYLPVLKRMYKSNSVEEIKTYASFSQIERFRKELDILQHFGLHKELDILVPSSQVTGRKVSDGKADIVFSVSNAKIKETYRDTQNKKRYQRKIRNAFIESIVYRSNQTAPHALKNPPLCLNCGAPTEAEGDTYFCPYCHSRYQTEAYHYLLTRFFMEGAFHNLRYVLFLLIALFLIALLQVKGKISPQQVELFSYVSGTFCTILFFFALVKGIAAYSSHRSVLQKIRSHDAHFSCEIFTMRLIDLLTQYPETLIPFQDPEKVSQGVIVKNIQHLQFQSYQRKNDWEIVECLGKVDGLYLTGTSKHVHIRERRKKIKICLARKYGTLTPVHYVPDQFTCPHCGSHQISEHGGDQVCSFCQSKIAVEEMDWVLYPALDK